jgi:hypothetical protein
MHLSRVLLPNLWRRVARTTIIAALASGSFLIHSAEPKE